jgi:putative AdoMet-dependent methyltransferase
MTTKGDFSLTRSLEHTTELFNRWATTYDKDLNTASGPLEGYYVSLHAAAEMLTLPNNASVLDVGVGTGKFAEIFEKMGASIFGVDVSEGMLAKM